MNKKIAVGLLSGVLTIGFAAGVFASGNLQEIKAYLNGEISFKLHGDDWRPKGSDGLEMLPITYEGSTYVPLRAVADALNVAVDYDTEAKSVILGEKAEAVSFFSKNVKIGEQYTRIEDVIDKKQLVVNGKQFEGAFRYELTNGDRIIPLSLGKAYTKAHLVMGAVGDSATVTIMNGKKQILASAKVEKDKTVEVDVDLYGADALQISYKGSTYENSQFYVFKESTVK